MNVVLATCQLVAILLAALVVGVFRGPWVGLTRSIASFPIGSFLAIGHRLNVNLAPLMTWLMPASLLAATPVLVLSAGSRPATFVLTLSGVALFVLALAVTVVVEVPIAQRIDAWSSEPEGSLPSDWARQRDRWAAVHVVRVVAGILGLALLVAGAVYR